MKIDRVELIHLRMKLVKPFETSFGRIDYRECVLVSVFSDGLEGYGECVADREPGFSSETVRTAWHILKDFLIPSLLSVDIHSPKDLPDLFAFVRGHPMAKSSLEMAAWDLLGKQSGISLRRMLGGIRDRVNVGVSVGLQETSAALVNVVEDYLNEGYARIKVKIKPGRDVGDVQAVRDAYPDLRLQVDANSSYTLETAEALLPLDKLRLLLIEQPLAEDDLWDHSKLQAKFSTALCLDESILGPRQARQALEMQACKIVNIKTGRVGGLSRAVATHDVCLRRGAPVWCGGMLETGVGRAANLALASLPGFVLPSDISATDRYYEEDITQERFVLNRDSSIDVPHAKPGLGVSIDKESLKRATVSSLLVKG